MTQGLAAQTTLDAELAFICHLPPPGIVQTHRRLYTRSHR
jgi:hypothetical protein